MAPSDLSSIQDLSATELQAPANAGDNLAAQVPKPTLEGSMLDSKTFTPKKGRTLAKQLLLYILPTALIPLAIVGGLESIVVQQEAKKEAIELLELESLLASEITVNYLRDLIKLPETMGLNPVLQENLKAAGESVVETGLHLRPIDEVEKEFSSSKLLIEDASLNQYFKDVTEFEDFNEMFVTERHGFNIARSHETSDFVQRDEDWWQLATQKGVYVGSPELDLSTDTYGIALSQAISDVKTGKFLGVIKSFTTIDELQKRLAEINEGTLSLGDGLQVWDTASGIAVSTVANHGSLHSSQGVSDDGETKEEVEHSEETVEGHDHDHAGTEINGRAEHVTALFNNETVQSISRVLDSALKNADQPLVEIETAIEAETGLTAESMGLRLERLISPSGDTILSALLVLDEHYFSIHTIPGTNWVTVNALGNDTASSEGSELLLASAINILLLAVVTTAVLFVLARRLAAPLNSLTTLAQAATDGKLDARAKLEGTIETQTLGAGFNALLNQTQALLKQQESDAQEQLRQRQVLEDEIAELMEDVGDAAEGDLRVRAKLSDGDVGIVADLFNSIIENLRITTRQVKSSTGQVTTSLLENEATVLDLSAQAVEEAESLKDTMEAVEDISQSIEEVASNANQASALTRDTYATVQAGSDSMDQTVESILGLRSTVGETAKKIKRLGESAQKISQAVNLIDEIALKTNLLAVNASVEAARAGEMGAGFTAVAEQVGSLAEQSAAATKEIAQIVSGIQIETQEVVEAIETGTAQVVNSTSLVEATKTRLAEVLLKSEQINQLMSQISASAQYQTESSAAVNDLVKEAAESSAQRSKSSQEMAKSIQETAKVAQALEASVEQFKLEDETV